MSDIVERLRGLADEHYEMLRDIHKPLLEAAAEIERLRALVEWRPIETAPEDGTELLVSGYIYNQPSKGRWMSVASFNGEEWHTEEATLHPPTHWLPLPSPPETKE